MSGTNRSSRAKPAASIASMIITGVLCGRRLLIGKSEKGGGENGGVGLVTTEIVPTEESAVGIELSYCGLRMYRAFTVNSAYKEFRGHFV